MYEMVDAQQQITLWERVLGNLDLAPLILQHLSTRQLFQATTISKSFHAKLHCSSYQAGESPTRLGPRELHQQGPSRGRS
ncbi:hypothetical protein WJX72_010814 [[Myrmecia] bisecta]|uniref:F-box domain-containing protein n=1 Tax=[Myrmecia] bisecta TaxID=41462 RepID=A0AAW1R9Q2_9CHLO